LLGIAERLAAGDANVIGIERRTRRRRRRTVPSTLFACAPAVTEAAALTPAQGAVVLRVVIVAKALARLHSRVGCTLRRARALCQAKAARLAVAARTVDRSVLLAAVLLAALDFSVIPQRGSAHDRRARPRCQDISSWRGAWCLADAAHLAVAPFAVRRRMLILAVRFAALDLTVVFGCRRAFHLNRQLRCRAEGTLAAGARRAVLLLALLLAPFLAALVREVARSGRLASLGCTARRAQNAF